MLVDAYSNHIITTTLNNNNNDNQKYDGVNILRTFQSNLFGEESKMSKERKYNSDYVERNHPQQGHYETNLFQPYSFFFLR